MSPAAPGQEQIRILVVDDEPSQRELYAAWLREAGYGVSLAASGEEAAARLKEDPDIILTDLLMPGAMDGNELVRRVRAAGHADVLILTGSPALETAIQALRDGAYDYLLKPPTEESLRAAVARCADKRRLSKELALEKALRAELKAAYEEQGRMARVREIFGQFATPEVAQFILAHPLDFWMQEEQRALTVLFADVRGFTPFARVAPPKEAVTSLNEIFERAVAAVHAEGGIVNKFLGDGMMALFGAPVPVEDHAGAAARAALKLRDDVEDLARLRQRQGRVPLRVGVGLNSGEMLVGCLGTRERTEYGVIGHAVNVASRLEHAAPAGTVFVGPGAVESLKGRFSLEDRGPVSLPGILEPVPVWELRGLSP